MASKKNTKRYMRPKHKYISRKRVNKKIRTNSKHGSRPRASTSDRSSSRSKQCYALSSKPSVRIDLTKMKQPAGMQNVKFDRYIKKLQKKVSPRTSIASDSLKVINCWMTGMLHKIGQEVSGRMGRRKVLKPKLINKALKKLVPGNMREVLNRTGMKAVERYTQSVSKKK